MIPMGPNDINSVRRVNDPAILDGHVVRQDDCTNLRIAEQYGVRFRDPILTSVIRRHKPTLSREISPACYFIKRFAA